MKKNLGIIQLELPEIVLSYAFNSNNSTDITSLLSEEQKLLINKAIKGEKNVIVSGGKIVDDDGENVNPYKLCYGNVSDKCITFVLFSSSGEMFVHITLAAMLNDTYYVYS